MNWWRTLTVAFWTFLFVMLVWQAHNYNSQVEAEAKIHPEKHYFYNPKATAAATQPKVSAPDVRQVAYKVIPHSPQPGNFTVQFTVKNVGNVAATAIQVKVRPYRGIMNGDDDNGNARPNGGVGPISDDDPVSQFGQWVALPDLAPGQSSSNSAVFVDQPGKAANEETPRMEIIFTPVKAK